ncbi:two-component sensor histidine kinase [Sporanaerobium hydrogeniformans]|uniref:Two-component sensor histidine kinase n=1 Tax=Sporanaerobium hydrogeniformans TaxID=3072179 RepID=A0AC61D8X5_9FIRM|nr:histidine kinase [Sporanaerobium hydrogeniformans]PHV69796.1 two-component sensor histidine kinase [Sporanaerobium hydrogeniformans]
MKKKTWRYKWHDTWLSLTIKKKISFFTGVVFLIILLSVMFDVWVVNFSLNDFRVILEDNARSNDFMEAIENESNCFEVYVKNPMDENLEKLEEAYKETRLAISRLPYDSSIGAYRYAKTWSIRNSYTVYEEKRDLLLKMDEENPGYIQELYKVYNMQSFLQDYARALMRYTLEEGTETYIKKIPNLRRVPIVVFIFGVLLLWGIISLARLMNKTIILPIVNLVSASKRIATNDFFVEDVKVENKDEMGELVTAFNKMKYATGQYIMALEEKREMLHLLHKEELEKLEVEKRLEATNLELLKNQINPHFLFNTLNVIGGMANLEEAKITEKMTKALSSLFRYNLKTPEAEVVLAQELKIARDYMYLQQMRFGSRIRYEIQCKLDTDKVKVPTFSFQPLIENAVIHGLSKKEEGGKVSIRIWRQGYYVMITVVDTGVGMTQEELEKLRSAFKEGATERIGIGLGNIYKRVHGMYQDGEVEVFSKKNKGTAVRVKIPYREQEE